MKSHIPYIIFLFLIAFFPVACSGSDNTSPNSGADPQPTENEATTTMNQLWGTSCLNYNTEREKAFGTIQSYADQCTSTYFGNYLKNLDTAAENMEKYELKTTQVENGTTVIWMLYNMGYVVKTPKGCFAIDICHIYLNCRTPIPAPRAGLSGWDWKGLQRSTVIKPFFPFGVRN